tara:strand:- start:432 stop:683 length:252 start_codon:yes stop_codon:yes gene_type:complete
MKIAELVTLVVVLILSVFTIHSCVSYLGDDKDKRNTEKALNECIEDVTKKCGNIIGYASDLEKENSRLNKLLKESRNKKCIQK